MEILPGLLQCQVGRGFTASTTVVQRGVPSSAVSRAAAAASPQRVARATAVGDSSPANDEVGGGGERWRTRPTDVDEMTKDRSGVG